jgi:trans-aconitate methyltransferase
MTADGGGSALAETLRGGLEERLALMAPSRRLRMALAEAAIAAFAADRRVRVLDAGCGDGLLSLAVAKRHPRWQIVGIDIRDDLLAGARERAANRGLDNVAFRQADLTRSLAETGFDVVMALECLNEIPDDRAALEAMTGALAPGGLFVVQAPERDWKPVLESSDATWREEVRHGYSAADLSAALGNAGLERIEITPTYRATAAVAQEVRDRIKDGPLPLRAAAFPAMLGAVRLEHWGLTGGRASALFATARRPPSDG